ncbi:putative disease resistance protein RGA4 isoform X3 [Panicum virgatum]|uniref:putative disease resistance protein RGA4 isoform X3 n=1 Tax=Panicum virgatum TaxID=38727 RepID=UPI0019D666A5|nr:putative disease resistance protein RGA4 isoform X3 [Panicum virgatum]
MIQSSIVILKLLKRTINKLRFSPCTIWCMTWQFHSLATKFWTRANKAIQGEAAANMHCSGIVAGHWSITALPKTIGELTRLRHLDLSDCYSIHELPVSFRNLENLAHLDLSNTYIIRGVSESLQSLSRLVHLNLSGFADIEDLTGAISGLTGLQYLNLLEVDYSDGLQQALINLTKLRYLNLGRKNYFHVRDDEAGFDSLLECVCSLSNLEYLNLARNLNLRTIPESIGNLRKLNTLDLSHCINLRRLPSSLSAISDLRFLHVTYCSKLDKSTLPQNKDRSALLPNFVVHAVDGESSSNLSELEDKHLTLLDISRLENVKSAEEAKRIKLGEKQSIVRLELAWTRDAKRFADDREVLSELVPPDTIETLTLQGYSSICFPSWMMSIAIYLPRLSDVTLRDLPSCNVLPPLGQLPNLESLRIGGMDSIRKIDGGFYGCRSAFPRLLEFAISRMECLEEWNAEDGLNELAFPKLWQLSINHCPLLRFKACWPPAMHVTIDSSDQILLSTWEDRDHFSASSSTATTSLHVKCCEVPLHQWSLLRHLPCLEYLKITDCSDLTCISTDLLQCISSLKILTVKYCKNGTVSLPERLGDLTSLTQLVLRDCSGIKSLPESIQQLTRLQRLKINGCPGLVQWCESEENKIKLVHIFEKILDGYYLYNFYDEQSGCLAAVREQKLENKGIFFSFQNNGGFPKAQDDEALKQWGKYLKLSTDFESSTSKDEKSGARDASHDANARLAFQILDDELLRVTRTRSTMPREQNLENKGGFSVAQDDDSKYERDLKQWGKDLKLSRDIESLMTKDENSGASEAGHDANAIEDRPAQQFSLGSWIGSTTTPQMLPVAGPSSSAAHLTRSPSNGSILGYMNKGGFSVAQDDDSKYERDLKQWGP